MSFPVSQNRRAARLRLPGGKSLGPGAGGCCSWLGARHCSLLTFQGASEPGNVCAGRSTHPAISTARPLCGELQASGVSPGTRTGEHTALTSPLRTASSLGSRLRSGSYRRSGKSGFRRLRRGWGWFTHVRAGILFYFPNSKEPARVFSPRRAAEGPSAAPRGLVLTQETAVRSG